MLGFSVIEHEKKTCFAEVRGYASFFTGVIHMRSANIFEDIKVAPSIDEEIAKFQLASMPRQNPTTDDRWVLASNLQKAIRRGMSEIAIGTSLKLLTLDPRYFWRRLPVIAYEDVGYGDIELVRTVLRTFRREALHKQYGEEKVAAYLVDSMCRARKSRTLCDAIAMLEFNVSLGELEKQCFDHTDEQLVSVACDKDVEPLLRVAVLRHVCGYRERVNGAYIAKASPRPYLMREICARLSLSELETTLFVSGQNVSEAINIPLPLVAQLARGGHADVQGLPSGFEGRDGILYAALDRHTRGGKRSFSRFAHEVDELASLFRRRPTLDPVEALGVSVFIAEGSALSHWVEFPGAVGLKQTFEQCFLEHARLSGDDGNELLYLTQTHLPELNRIREEIM